MDPMDFASLLCSRLCHDLVGPVGAMHNGVELLADEQDPDMRQQCLQLLATSIAQTSDRLKFFRLAFGSGSGFGSDVAVDEIKAGIEGWFGSSKVRIEWMLDTVALPKLSTKVLLNLSMIAGDSLLRGGVLHVGAQPHAGGWELAIRAEGERLLLRDQMREALTSDVAFDDLDPRSAPAFMVRRMLNAANAELSLSEPADGVLLIGTRLPA